MARIQVSWYAYGFTSTLRIILNNTSHVIRPLLNSLALSSYHGHIRWEGSARVVIAVIHDAEQMNQPEQINQPTDELTSQSLQLAIHKNSSQCDPLHPCTRFLVRGGVCPIPSLCRRRDPQRSTTSGVSQSLPAHWALGFARWLPAVM